jgi:histidinol-phosphatase (PHP family)
VLFNLHTHTSFSDGSDAPEKYVEEAIKQGFHTLGFSDHSPVPFENTFAIREGGLEEYCKTVRDIAVHHTLHEATNQLKGKNFSQSSAEVFAESREVSHGLNNLRKSADNLRKSARKKTKLIEKSLGAEDLDILLGIEVDYIPGITHPINYYRANFNFDYFIGSVHFVKGLDSNDLWFIDGPNIEIYDKGLKEIFVGDIRAAVTAYYHQLDQMITDEKPDIIGHLDKIIMYNRERYFLETDDWYIALVDETLDLAKKSGSVIEVNTRGVYKKRSDTFFPGPEILKKIKALKIPITLSSDAHKPSELSLYFPEAKNFLADMGFITMVMRNKNGWEEVPLL